MKADLVVKGRLLHPDGAIREGAFSVVGGRIVAMKALPADEVRDHGARLVVPGAIDPHVHFRDPGAPQKEDFGSGTAGAALGGVTTVMDMPNTNPPVFTQAAFDDKMARAAAKAHVDFGIYAGLDEKGEAIGLLARASAMKVYLGATTGHLLVRDYDLVRRALLAAAEAGRTVAFHAESQACLERHAYLADATYPSHSTSRPPACEAEAIRMLTAAAAGTGARVHIAHLSTAEGLAATSGTPFTSEVCPHHLLLNETMLAQGGRFKMNPPLRAREDVDALWGALASGRIACLASDHAPHTREEKDAPRMGECPAGVPGVQTLLPILLPHAASGRISLSRLLDASVAAARVFGLPRKGALAEGMDADYAVYDLDAQRPVRAAEMASRAGWTPFEGMPAIFPIEVALRGARIVEAGRLVGRAGAGRFVAPGAPAA